MTGGGSSFPPQKSQHLDVCRRLIIPTIASCQLGVSSGVLIGKWRSYLWKGFWWEIVGANTQFLKNRIFNPAAEQHRSSQWRECVLQGPYTAPRSQGTKMWTRSSCATNCEHRNRALVALGIILVSRLLCAQSTEFLSCGCNINPSETADGSADTKDM